MIANHEVAHACIGDLAGADYNPRDIDAVSMAALKASLHEFGFVQPVVVRREDNLIVGGHQRVAAMIAIAQEAGDDPTKVKVPVLYLDGFDDAKTKLLNLALNKISGEWNYDKLVGMLNELSADGEVGMLAATGFSDGEIEDLCAFSMTVHPDAPTPKERPTAAAARAAAETSPEVETEVWEFEFEMQTDEQAALCKKALSAAGMTGPSTAAPAFAEVCRGALANG